MQAIKDGRVVGRGHWTVYGVIYYTSDMPLEWPAPQERHFFLMTTNWCRVIPIHQDGLRLNSNLGFVDSLRWKVCQETKRRWNQHRGSCAGEGARRGPLVSRTSRKTTKGCEPRSSFCLNPRVFSAKTLVVRKNKIRGHLILPPLKLPLLW
jgi:hypothetical protein